MSCHSHSNISNVNDTSGIHEQMDIVRNIFFCGVPRLLDVCNISNHSYHKPNPSKSARQHDRPRQYEVLTKLKAHVSTFLSECPLIIFMRRRCITRLNILSYGTFHTAVMTPRLQSPIQFTPFPMPQSRGWYSRSVTWGARKRWWVSQRSCLQNGYTTI